MYKTCSPISYLIEMGSHNSYPKTISAEVLSESRHTFEKRMFYSICVKVTSLESIFLRLTLVKTCIVVYINGESEYGEYGNSSCLHLPS